LSQNFTLRTSPTFTRSPGAPSQNSSKTFTPLIARATSSGISWMGSSRPFAVERLADVGAREREELAEDVVGLQVEAFEPARLGRIDCGADLRLLEQLVRDGMRRARAVPGTHRRLRRVAVEEVLGDEPALLRRQLRGGVRCHTNSVAGVVDAVGLRATRRALHGRDQGRVGAGRASPAAPVQDELVRRIHQVLPRTLVLGAVALGVRVGVVESGVLQPLGACPFGHASALRRVQRRGELPELLATALALHVRPARAGDAVSEVPSSRSRALADLTDAHVTGPSFGVFGRRRAQDAGGSSQCCPWSRLTYTTVRGSNGCSLPLQSTEVMLITSVIGAWRWRFIP
jgi:hypothetical protein